MEGIRKERRRSPRFLASKSVLYNRANRLATAKTADIGAGGVRIVSDTPIRNGETFEFLVLLEGLGLKFKGTVVHTTCVEEGRILAGISFNEESSFSIRLLDDYLRNHMNSLPKVDGPLRFEDIPASSGS